MDVTCVDIQGVANQHRPIADATVLLVALALFVVAYRLRARPTAAAVAIASGAATLGLGFSLDGYLHEWDEQFHALVAKNLLAQPLVPTLYDEPVLPAATTWGTSHVWLHKPPLALYLIAASLSVVGPCELAVRIPSVVLFAAATYAVARLGMALFSPRVGLVAAFLHAVHGHLLALASGRTATDHPESLMASLVCIATWLAVRQVDRGGGVLRAIGVGIAVGLAVLTKFLPALVVFPVWAVYTMGRDRPVRPRVIELGVALGVCIALVLPWYIYTHMAFPAAVAYEADHAWRHLTEPLDGHAGPVWFHLARIPRLFGELSPLAVAWFLATLPGARQAGERRSRWTVLTWFAAPYAFFTLIPTRLPGYVMLSAPAIMLMIGTFVDRLLAWLHATRQTDGTRWRRRAAWVGIVFLLALPVRSMVERYRPFRGLEEETTRAASLRALGAELADDARVVLFNAARPWDTMFYTGRPAYPNPPTDEERRFCEARGYRVIVLAAGARGGRAPSSASAAGDRVEETLRRVR